MTTRRLEKERDRSRSLRRRRFRQLEIEEGRLFLEALQPTSGGGFWIPELPVAIFGAQPSWTGLRRQREERLTARNEDLHAFFDELQQQHDSADETSSFDSSHLEHLARLPLQPTWRVGHCGRRSYIYPQL